MAHPKSEPTIRDGRGLVRGIRQCEPETAMMLAKTYEALKAAGSPDDKAREAAEEIAGYDNRLAKIESDLSRS